MEERIPLLRADVRLTIDTIWAVAQVIEEQRKLGVYCSLHKLLRQGLLSGCLVPVVILWSDVFLSIFIDFS